MQLEFFLAVLIIQKIISTNFIFSLKILQKKNNFIKFFFKMQKIVHYLLNSILSHVLLDFSNELRELEPKGKNVLNFNSNWS